MNSWFLILGAINVMLGSDTVRIWDEASGSSPTRVEEQIWTHASSRSLPSSKAACLLWVGFCLGATTPSVPAGLIGGESRKNKLASELGGYCHKSLRRLGKNFYVSGHLYHQSRGVGITPLLPLSRSVFSSQFCTHENVWRWQMMPR